MVQVDSPSLWSMTVSFITLAGEKITLGRVARELFMKILGLRGDGEPPSVSGFCWGSTVLGLEKLRLDQPSL